MCLIFHLYYSIHKPCSFFLLLIQPITELEKEIADVLTGSSNVEKDDEELTDAEKRALLRMSVEEVQTCNNIYVHMLNMYMYIIFI